MPTWIGAYLKEMEEGSGDKARAVALADSAVVDSQGSGQLHDQSQVQRDYPLFTNYYSYANTYYNLQAERVNRTDFTSKRSIGRLAGSVLLMVYVPQVINSLVLDALRDDWDEEQSWAEYLILDQGISSLAFVASSMLGTRELSGTIQGYYGYQGPASLRMYSAVPKVIQQLRQGKFDTAAWHAGNELAGLVFHYPATALRRLVDGIEWMFEEGEFHVGRIFTPFVGTPQKARK